MTVAVSCENHVMFIDMHLSSGAEITDSDVLTVLANDYLSTGGDDLLKSVMPQDGYPIDDSLPMTRDVFVDWLRDTGGVISDSEFSSNAKPNWTRPPALDRNCTL